MFQRIKVFCMYVFFFFPLVNIVMFFWDTLYINLLYRLIIFDEINIAVV